MTENEKEVIEFTSIRITKERREALKDIKIVPQETYDNVIKRILVVYKKNTTISNKE